MTILMFGWEFPPHITGGLGTACFGLTKSLSMMGVDIIFVVPKAYGDENNDIARVLPADTVPLSYNDMMTYYNNASFKYLEINSKLVPYQTDEQYYEMVNKTSCELIAHSVNKSAYFSFSGSYGTDLYSEVERYSIVATAIAGQYSFDVIHCHDWLTYKAGIEAKKVCGKPLVIHVHATEYDRSGEGKINTLIYDIEKQGMDAADKIICVSNLTKEIIVSRYNQPMDKIVVIHNGVDKTHSPMVNLKRKTKKIVTFLGRITHQKGPEYFVDAVYKIMRKDKDVHFVMVGSGDMYNQMIALVAAKDMADRFHFTGFLQQNEVNKILALSDVYVMPSVSEPFGISALEALQRDVPIVISRQSGVSEVVDNALKVDYWDTDSMADAIYGLLHYSQLRKTMNKAAKKDLQNLSWNAAAEKVKYIYSELI